MAADNKKSVRTKRVTTLSVGYTKAGKILLCHGKEQPNNNLNRIDAQHNVAAVSRKLLVSAFLFPSIAFLYSGEEQGSCALATIDNTCTLQSCYHFHLFPKHWFW